MSEICCHCDLNSFAYTYPLTITENFTVVCDVHPLAEGHLLIIPKQHLSCVGAFDTKLMDEFIELYEKCTQFIRDTYGQYSSFEHGVIGQTVFHSHLHIVPGKMSPLEIIPEGEGNLTEIDSLSALQPIYNKLQKYLFVSFEEEFYTVNTDLGVPRFFRDRFARALDRDDRGNWKTMRENKELMVVAAGENESCEIKWDRWAK